MQAVILAAGKGVRMRPLTLDRPKPLIKVAGKPILERNLDQMSGLVDEAIIIVGYKKEMIMDYFGSSYRDVKLTYVVQEEQLGTGHALLQAENKIKGKFLVLNGDDLYSRKDMENISRYDNCILVKKSKDTSSFGVVLIKEGKVSDIVEKPTTLVSDLINSGMYCFTSEIFDLLKKLKISERGEYEITDAIRELARQGKMDYVELSGFWIPIGNPQQLIEASKKVSNDDSNKL